MPGNSSLLHPTDIPSHIQKQLHLILCRLNIPYIQNPHLADTFFVCLLHLLIKQVRTRRRKPQVVVRTPPIRHMIVNAIPSGTSGLFGSREMGYISIVVVTPHQSHILRHLQSCLINIQHLLIRNQHLRHFCQILSFIFCQHTTLVCQNLRKRLLLFFQCLGSLHLAIVYTAHT